MLSRRTGGLHGSAHPPFWASTRYWGFYANAARGKRRKVEEVEPTSTRPSPEATDDAFTRQARLSWAKLIRRVYEIEPLLCPFCGGQMKILAFTTDFATARAIRRSLNLPTQKPEPGVLCPVDLTHTTSAELFDDLVVVERLANHLRHRSIRNSVPRG